MGDSGQAGRCFQADSDTEVTQSDQEKINRFARYYAKRSEILAELEAKQNELKNLEDAAEELCLYDENESDIPFFLGQVFICLNLNEAFEALTKEKQKLKFDIKELEEISNDLKSVLSNLKTQLYAKFGSQMNLED